MRPRGIVMTIALAGTFLAADPSALAAQSEPAAAVRSDPCHFYRARAWGQGIGDYTTEMLWACEAIAARRAAAVPLGARLEAMAVALESFREAIVEAGGATLVASQRLQSRHLGLSRQMQRDIAERTGVLAGLAAIQTGY